MLKRLALFTASAVALMAVGATFQPARAADLPPPPPPLRPAVHDWTGPYIGGVAGVVCIDTLYVPSAGSDPELNGCGFIGGVVGGLNYQVGTFVVGVEGDYSWGEKTGKNTLDAVDFTIDSLATVRGRLGFLATPETLIYATGGVGWLDGDMDALVGPASIPMSDQQTHFGFVVGGGIEHAFTSYLHGRIEYLYGSFDAEDYDLTVPGVCFPTCTVDTPLDDVHIMRAGLTYNFGSLFW